MLQLSASLVHRQVMSLRTSTAIAEILEPIINPDNLKIEGFYCSEYDQKEPRILLCQDIRDTVPQGFIVNDSEVLADPDELVRMQLLFKRQFVLKAKPVETISGDKIGKVNDFAYDSTSMYIQKIYVSRSLLKSLTSGSLSIDRTQIHETTADKIIINDLLATVPAAVSPASA